MLIAFCLRFPVMILSLQFLVGCNFYVLNIAKKKKKKQFGRPSLSYYVDKHILYLMWFGKNFSTVEWSHYLFSTIRSPFMNRDNDVERVCVRYECGMHTRRMCHIKSNTPTVQQPLLLSFLFHF